MGKIITREVWEKAALPEFKKVIFGSDIPDSEKLQRVWKMLNNFSELLIRLDSFRG